MTILLTGNETAESHKQIEAKKTLEYHDTSSKSQYYSDEYEEYLKLKEKFEKE